MLKHIALILNLAIYFSSSRCYLLLHKLLGIFTTRIANDLDFLVILARKPADFKKRSMFESPFQANQGKVVLIGTKYATSYAFFLIYVIILADSLMHFHAILKRNIDIGVIKDPCSKLIALVLVNIGSSGDNNVFRDTEGSCIVHAGLLLLIIPNRDKHSAVFKETLLGFLLFLAGKTFIDQDVGLYTKGPLTL